MARPEKKEQSFTMLRRVPAGLAPLSEYDHERLSKVPLWADVRAELTMPRSLPRHRFYWVCLGLVVENTERWRTAEDLHTAIKVKLGYVEDFLLIDGSVLIRPRSTDFEAMDELAFREYMEAAFMIIATDILPGVDIDALKREGRRKAGTK